MAADFRPSQENSSLFVNSTQKIYPDYFNWCRGYPAVPVIWSVLSLICFLLGLPASLWVLHELLQKHRSTRDVFMFGLTVLDLIFIAQIPVSVCNFMLWYIKHLQLLMDFIASLNLFGRPLFMACICWECYVAVVYPIIYKTSPKLVVVKVVITAVICCVVTAGAVALCCKLWLITTPFTAVPLLMALPVIAFCDFSTLLTLRKPNPTGNIIIHPQKKRALHTISNSLVMTFVVYLPPVIIFTFGDLIPLTDPMRYCSLNFLGFCLNMAGCFIMPLLYLDTVGKLERLKTCFRK